MTSKEKRDLFFESNPDIRDMYDNILRLNNLGGDNRNAFESIKKYAIEHSPFYSKYKTEDKLPIMTKIDLIENYEEIFCPIYKGKVLHKMSTSGSTGIPFTIEQNVEKRRRVIAELKAYGLYANHLSHECMVYFRALNGLPIDRVIDERDNIWRYDVSFLNDDTMSDLIRFYEEHKPVIIFGYCSTIDTISTYIINNHIQLKHKPASVLVGSELLTKEVAERIQSVFGCPIFDRYSNQEMGILAQREYGETDFRFNVASYHLEIVKLDKDEPCDEGELGRIVITDLYNKAFPMLRYDTGDVGSYIVNDGKIYLKEVLGRRVDIIFDTQGRSRQPHMITNVMWGVKNIRQWQFIQMAAKDYIIKVSSLGMVDELDVISRLQRMLGEDANIVLQYVEDIPVANSQKRRYIVNIMKR